MKIVLLKDVAKLGRKYDIKEVSRGHASNFLIPKGLAEPATVSAVKKAETFRLQTDSAKKVKDDLLIKNITSLSGVTVEMTSPANELGHLFAGIHKEEIVPEISKQTNLEILPEHIVLEKPIKEVGEHEIEINVQDVLAKFKLVVKAK